MKSFSINIEQDPGSDSSLAHVVMKGTLTVAYAREAQTSFVSALRSYRQITISLKEVTSIDLAFIQVVYALLQTGNVRIELDIPEDVRTMLNNSGIITLLQHNQPSMPYEKKHSHR